MSQKARSNRRHDEPVTRRVVATPEATVEAPARQGPNWLNIILLVAAAAGFLGLGLLTLGEEMPLGEVQTANLLVVFLTGLTTGGLTCLAVQGGLLATTLAQREADGPVGFSGRAAPIAMFLGAKILAYTVLGALLGLLGTAIGLTPMLQGALQILAGLFMLGVAGQMLNLHPIFRLFSLTPPKSIQRLIRRESKSGSLLAPVVLGLLTVFIPCATTQAMMIAALGSGSALVGGAILFAFTLGTTPLFFSLGYLATQLGAAFQKGFTRIAAVAIIVLAFLSVTAGLALLGAPVPDLAFVGSSGVGTVATSASVPAVGTVQEVTLRAEPTAYVPNRIVFKVGTPGKLKLVTGDRLGCTSSFLIPSLGYQKILSKNQQAVFDIPTDRPRKIPFTCSMGMYRGVIEVEA